MVSLNSVCMRELQKHKTNVWADFKQSWRSREREKYYTELKAYFKVPSFDLLTFCSSTELDLFLCFQISIDLNNFNVSYINAREEQ